MRFMQPTKLSKKFLQSSFSIISKFISFKVFMRYENSKKIRNEPKNWPFKRLMELIQCKLEQEQKANITWHNKLSQDLVHVLIFQQQTKPYKTTLLLS